VLFEAVGAQDVAASRIAKQPDSCIVPDVNT
jgi:hypothetical protein